ncbi:MAG: 4-hydroxybenzoate octaprenyltransferase [Zoogloeaceae bacterium]|jgi:4-hydroxybenzoate polyprenyltransferase|nr:4-hydroxybenzoate octaprenyltransferase [Zoogloeaceae bacterium]
MNMLTQRLNEYEKLMRLDKPIGSLLLFWPTLWALWLSSDGQPVWMLVWIFALGTVLMRSAGCVINDYADRDFDPAVERTRDRPLAARRVSPWEALYLAAALVLFAFLLLLPILTKLLLLLGCIAVFLAASYPFTKRFFAIPQAYLGVAYGFGIPMAYAAQQGSVPWQGWLLLAANVFWTVAYDTEYAMVDRPDDLKIGIRTSAITFGRFDVAAVMCCYAIAFGLIAWVGLIAGLGWIFLASILAAFVLAGYHYSLIRARQGPGCFKAFLHNNWVGVVIFVGIALDYLFHGVKPF